MIYFIKNRGGFNIMRIIHTIDKKDYDPNSKAYYRPSSKGIIFDKNHKLILLYSKKFDFYEFPGGGH